jgi:hypothetical protein
VPRKPRCSRFTPHLLERTERNVHERLEPVLSPAEREQFQARVAVETGAPVERILDYAQRSGIDRRVGPAAAELTRARQRDTWLVRGYFGATQLKFAASFMSPEPLYSAYCG